MDPDQTMTITDYSVEKSLSDAHADDKCSEISRGMVF